MAKHLSDFKNPLVIVEKSVVEGNHSQSPRASDLAAVPEVIALQGAGPTRVSSVAARAARASSSVVARKQAAARRRGHLGGDAAPCQRYQVKKV